MKNTIIIIVVAAMLLLGYWYYSAPAASSGTLLVQSGAGVDGGEVIGQKTISLLQQLAKVSIDQQIFATPAFQSLIDFGVDIQEEPVGRPDPFAPIGSEGGAAFSPVSASSTATSTPPRR